MEVKHTENGLVLHDKDVQIEASAIESSRRVRFATVVVTNGTQGVSLYPESRIDLLKQQDRNKMLGDLTVKGKDIDWEPLINRLCDEVSRYTKRGTGAGAQPQGSEASEPPRPLRRDIPPAAPYPIAALGDTIGRMAMRIMAVVKTPDAIAAQSCLAAANVAVQGLRNVHINGRIRPLSENFVTLGESGERKSEADYAALRKHRDVEEKRHREYSMDLPSHLNRLDAYNKSRQEILNQKKSSYEIKKCALDDLGPPPEMPLEPGLSTCVDTLKIKGLTYAWQNPYYSRFADEL